MRARAICVFPGGFGTLDEMFEALTLIQTGRMARVPFLLFGRAFWEKIINWEALADAGTISAERSRPVPLCRNRASEAMARSSTTGKPSPLPAAECAAADRSASGVNGSGAKLGGQHADFDVMRSVSSTCRDRCRGRLAVACQAVLPLAVGQGISAFAA